MDKILTTHSQKSILKKQFLKFFKTIFKGSSHFDQQKIKLVDVNKEVGCAFKFIKKNATMNLLEGIVGYSFAAPKTYSFEKPC